MAAGFPLGLAASLIIILRLRKSMQAAASQPWHMLGPEGDCLSPWPAPCASVPFPTLPARPGA